MEARGARDPPVGTGQQDGDVGELGLAGRDLRSVDAEVSPSRVALVIAPARSEPPVGSLSIAPQFFSRSIWGM